MVRAEQRRSRERDGGRDPQFGVRPGKKAKGKFSWLSWRLRKIELKYWKLLGIADPPGLCIVFTFSFDSMTI